MGTPRWIDTLAQFLAGGSGGVTATSLVYPLDRLKMMGIRQGRIDWESIRARPTQLFEGLQGALIETFVYNAVSFGMYEVLKAAYVRRAGLPKGSLLPPPAAAVVGCCAGVLTSFAASPLKVIEMRQQGGGGEGWLQAFINIHKEHGPGGFFRGVEGSLAMAPMDTTINFFSMDVLKALTARLLLPNGTAAQQRQLQEQLSAGTLLLLGFVAKALCVCVLFPIGSAKDKLQSLTGEDMQALSPRSRRESSSILGIWRQTLRKSSIFALYRGFRAALVSNCFKGALRAYVNERAKLRAIALLTMLFVSKGSRMQVS